MMKSYYFDVLPSGIGYDSSIRNKYQIINLLISISSNFLIKAKPYLEDVACDLPNKIRIIFYSDKISRVFIIEPNNKKIHSFNFPFKFIIDKNSYKIFFESYEIDISICYFLKSIFKECSDELTINNILERLSDPEIDSYSIDLNFIEKIVLFLLTFEPGYLRYDFDEYHENTLLHPRCHLDINYSTKTTYKLGLTKSLNFFELLDIIDTKKCYYISTCSSN